jgi:hypothetical protein
MTVPELSHQLGLSQNSRRSDPGKSFDIFDGADRRRRLHLPSRLPKKQVRQLSQHHHPTGTPIERMLLTSSTA